MQPAMSETPQSELAESSFYDEIMNAQPILPSKLLNKKLSCGSPRNDKVAAHEFNFAEPNLVGNPDWFENISHNWTLFDILAETAKVLVIDFKSHDEKLGFRYLANDNTHLELYEPWSSSKIQAFTGAIAQLKAVNPRINASGSIGGVSLADMVTSINTYEPTGNAPDDSNALASLMADIAGRNYLTDLFYDSWLKLPKHGAFFRGAYGPVSFQPEDLIYRDKMFSLDLSKTILTKPDEGYLDYRCTSCGKTGNKPMSTLSQAEWLKRLALHQRMPETAHPKLEYTDVLALFYGGQTDAPHHQSLGGMKAGISNMLQLAIAESISAENVGLDKEKAKHVLDTNTRGEWRVFQKIGWGPSETRSKTENVVLAHVCLPHYQGGREFTVAAQVAVNGNSEANLPIAGQRMHEILVKAMQQLLLKDATKDTE